MRRGTTQRSIMEERRALAMRIESAHEARAARYARYGSSALHGAFRAPHRDEDGAARARDGHLPLGEVVGARLNESFVQSGD